MNNVSDMDLLQKIDAVRQRAGVSYQKAREALEAGNGDVVQALIWLEQTDQARTGETRTERIQCQGSELVARVKELIKEGNVRKVVVRQDDRVVFELPLTLGAIGVVVAPQLAALGALAALITNCTVEVVRTTD